MNKIIRYFDLYSRSRGTALGQAGGNSHSIPVWLQYLAAFAGVLVSPFLLEYYKSGTPPSLPMLGQFVWHFVYGMIVAFVLLPATYKSVTSEDKPNVIQLATVFSIGLGWQSIISAILR